MTDLHAEPQLTTIEVRKPADGSVLGSVSTDSPDAVSAKAGELRLFQPEWEAMGANGRKDWLLKFQDWILDAMANGFSFALPMGGWKRSGIGARNGAAYGLLKYCRTQAITAPRIATQSREPLWFPYKRRTYRATMAVVRGFAARGTRRFGIKPKGGSR